MVRVFVIFLAVEGEHHVVGIKLARWFKVFIILPLHAFTQVEGIGFTVLADIPLLSKTRNNFSRTGFEFNQTVVNRHRTSVIGGTRGE